MKYVSKFRDGGEDIYVKDIEARNSISDMNISKADTSSLASLKNSVTADISELENSKADKVTVNAQLSSMDGRIDSISSNVYEGISNLETQQQVLSARMDTFTNLPEGSTSGDAELADIRVGANGYEYSSAGDAVRTQIEDVTNAIDSFRNNEDSAIFIKKNLIASVVEGKYPNYGIGGVIITDNSGYGYVKIPVKSGSKYAINIFISSNFSFWSQVTDGVEYGISKITDYSPDNVLTAPQNAKFLYVTLPNLTNSSDIIILESDKSIRGYSVNDFPFNTVVSTEIDQLGGSKFDYNSLETYGTYPNKNFAIRNVAVSNNELVFYSSTSRVMNNPDDLYHLKQGDIVRASSATVRYFVIYKSNNTWFTKGWNKGDFIIPFDCDAIILLSFDPEADIASANELSQYLSIIKRESLANSVSLQTVSINSINENVKSINHQGFNMLAPNESLPAYRLSKKYGFKYVEGDVLKTSDGIYVMNHDDDISKTGTFYYASNNQPVESETLISNMTYQQLITNYTIRKSLYDEYENCKVARFDDFILLCKNLGLHPYIELKTGGLADSQALYQIVKEYGMKNNVTWVSTVYQYLNHIRGQNEDARVGLIVNEITESAITTIQGVTGSSKNKFITANYSNVTSGSIEYCITADIPLEVWTLDNASDILSINPYISGITSNKLVASNILANS